MALCTDQQFVFALELSCFHFLKIFFQAFQAFLNLAEITNNQIEVDVLDIAQRVDLTDMRNRGIIKCAYYMSERINLAQMSDVSALLERFLADCANINVFHRSVNQLFGVVEHGEPIEAVIGNFGDPNVGFTRVGEGMLRKLRLGKDTEQ